MSACPICKTPRDVAFTHLVLKKYQVKYLVCGHCGLLQTETPYWLDEAYGEAIAGSDTGLVQRNSRMPANSPVCFVSSRIGTVPTWTSPEAMAC